MFDFFKKKNSEAKPSSAEKHTASERSGVSKPMHVLNAMTGAELAEEGLRQIVVAIKNNAIKIEPGRVYPDVYAHGDQPNGVNRITYVMFSPTVQNKVMSRCTIIFDSVREGVITWQVDWAVDKEYRGNNWGKTIAVKALTEFCNGMQGKFPGGFAIEAVVDEGNEASIRIANGLLGNEEIIFNEDTGKNVHTFLRHFEL
ncbi:TPA: hypothetical protein NID02_001580 [Pseudomonas aeruginosa]|nr:hypothetical protein [Pseudomonas aeruginosa]